MVVIATARGRLHERFAIVVFAIVRFVFISATIVLMDAGLAIRSMIFATLNMAFPIHTCRFAMRIVAVYNPSKPASQLSEQENDSERYSEQWNWELHTFDCIGC